MKVPLPASSGKGVSRFTDRLLHPWSHPGDDKKAQASTRVPVKAPQRPVGFPASISEFLLVFRLRARRSSTQSADLLERAVRVVFVTCQHWFAHSDQPTQESRQLDR